MLTTRDAGRWLQQLQQRLLPCFHAAQKTEIKTLSIYSCHLKHTLLKVTEAINILSVEDVWYSALLDLLSVTRLNKYNNTAHQADLQTHFLQTFL